MENVADLAFLGLPYVYDGSDGSLSWSGNSEEGSHSKKGQVVCAAQATYSNRSMGSLF